MFNKLGHNLKKVSLSLPLWTCYPSRARKQLVPHSKRPHPVTAVTQALTAVCFVQSEIEEMIWEVDEDCDQCVTWAEFQNMYHRCRTDQTGACSCSLCYL